MIPIYVVEDDPKQQENICQIINNYIFIEELDARIVHVAADPHQMLSFFEQNYSTAGLYFFDIDLNSDMDGMKLAASIRKIDPSGKIVFITTHENLAYLTFKYMIEAMDYIVKSESPELIKRRIGECIKEAYDRLHEDTNKGADYYQTKINGQHRSVEVSRIMYFESSHIPHHLNLVLDNAIWIMSGSIKGIEKEHQHFISCHRSYVINVQNIALIDQKESYVELVNGQRIPISVRRMKPLLEAYKARLI